jgi:hypothetical protein
VVVVVGGGGGGGGSGGGGGDGGGGGGGGSGGGGGGGIDNNMKGTSRLKLYYCIILKPDLLAPHGNNPLLTGPLSYVHSPMVSCTELQAAVILGGTKN